MGIPYRVLSYMGIALTMISMMFGLPPRFRQDRPQNHMRRSHHEHESFRLPPEVLAEENLKRFEIRFEDVASDEEEAVVVEEKTIVASSSSSRTNQTIPTFEHLPVDLSYTRPQKDEEWWEELYEKIRTPRPSSMCRRLSW